MSALSLPDASELRLYAHIFESMPSWSSALLTGLSVFDRSLNVLRGLLADTTNASKTSSPIKTDLNLLALLKKRVAASKAAAQEFASANRDDLKEKEESQVAVLEEYASKIDAVGEEEVRKAVEQTVDELKKEGAQLKFGAIMARVMAEGGRLAKRPVEKSLLARVLKTELEGRT